jgi:hypothetical protein
MVDQQTVRGLAQSQAFSVVNDHLDLSDQRTYTRKEAASTVGKSWNDLSTLYVYESASVGELRDALEALEEDGFTAVLDRDGERVAISVSMSVEKQESLTDELR